MSDEVKIPLPQSLQEIVGALLFASETPLTAADVREAVRGVEAAEGENKEVMDVYRTCTAKEVAEALRGLEKALEVAGCGFRLVCTGGAYRLQSVPSCGRYVRALLKMDRPNRLGRASLETLAIIAYRQPLTKGEIESIRGVDVSGNVKTLMDLQLIRLVGKSELPGHPFLYGTTPLFLEHFGLASLQQLNELDPTLQRSNPKQKAASYKKNVEEKVEAGGGERNGESLSEASARPPVPDAPDVSHAASSDNAPISTSTSGLDLPVSFPGNAPLSTSTSGLNLPVASSDNAPRSTSTSGLDLPVSPSDELAEDAASEPIVLGEVTDDDDLLSGDDVSGDGDDLLSDDAEDEFDDEEDDDEDEDEFDDEDEDDEDAEDDDEDDDDEE